MLETRKWLHYHVQFRIHFVLFFARENVWKFHNFTGRRQAGPNCTNTYNYRIGLRYSIIHAFDMLSIFVRDLESLCEFILQTSSVGFANCNIFLCDRTDLPLFQNTFVYLNTWIAVRMEMHPSCIFFLKFVEELIPGFLAWTKYFTWWFLHIQFLSAASLTVHRISSFWWPQSCEKVVNVS